MANDQSQRNKLLTLVVGAAIGACIAALVFFSMPKSATDTTTSNSLATPQNGTAQEEVADAKVAAPEKAIPTNSSDVAKAFFPSWNAKSESLAGLITYVQSVCDPNNGLYLEPEDRIATFDMDGTIFAERAPYYVDYLLFLYRMLDDPTYDADDETVAFCKTVRNLTNQGTGDMSQGARCQEVFDQAFAGMTPKEFRKYVNDFMDTQEAKGFEGMTYGSSFFKPMLEVIEYLRANDFDIWMVSACNCEVVRGVVERLGISPDHVIGTDNIYASSKQGDKNPGEYTMGQEEDIVLSAPIRTYCAKNYKPIAIARNIGKQPKIAFGNSSGDYAMLNYAKSSGGAAFLVVADDTTRDYGDKEGASKAYDMVAEQGWTAFSMKDDWATIYGDGVKKTELPSANEAEDGKTELAEAA